MNIAPFSPTEQKERSNFGQCTVPFSAPPILKIPSVPIGHRDRPKLVGVSITQLILQDKNCAFHLKIQVVVDVVAIHNLYLDNRGLVVDFLSNLKISMLDDFAADVPLIYRYYHLNCNTIVPMFRVMVAQRVLT